MTRSQRHRTRPDYTIGLEDDASNNGNDSIHSGYSSSTIADAEMDLNLDQVDDDMELEGGEMEELKANDEQELLHGLSVGEDEHKGDDQDLETENDANYVADLPNGSDVLAQRKRSSSEHLVRVQDPQDDHGTRKRSFSAADL